MEKSPLEDLKSRSVFQISGIVAIDGTPQRSRFPNAKEKLKITEHHFLWVLKKPNPTHFSLFLYFYPIQHYKEHSENLLTIYNQNSYIRVNLEEANKLVLKLGGLTYSVNQLRIHEWNSFVLNIDLNKSSFFEVNGEKKDLTIPKKTFDAFIHEENYYAKFGDKNEKASFKGLIANFYILNCELNPELPNIFAKKAASSLSQFPLNEAYVRPFSKMEDFLNWTPNDPLNVATVPLKKVERNPKKVKSLTCHDMKGGYTEDSWLYGYNTMNTTYRFFHFSHIDYFIYFSHYLLTIPPPSWTNICHQFGVLSLGVLITEGDGGMTLNHQILQGENNNPFFYADCLIEICKYYNFDGWLINIESATNYSKMAQWVTYLTRKSHEVIPGSIIIWYDSVITTGEVSWQSELNNQNYSFFDASDIFFTDYHWNLDKLKRSVLAAGDQKLKLFHGIDIWGRGAYAGGQYNTWQGCKACQDHNCSIALFAQAFTYEKSSSRENFILNDNKLWYGDNFVRLFIPKESKWVIELAKGQGWDVFFDQGLDSEVAVTSHDLCVRSFSADLLVSGINVAKENAIIEFSLMVKGTPPKVEDRWIAVIELYDAQNKFIASIDTVGNELVYHIQDFSQKMGRATAEWTPYCLSIDFSKMPSEQRNRVRYAKFLEGGQDIEYWAGHYGARFCQEEMILKSNDPKKDMTKYLKTRRIMELPIHTYFNEGQGLHYWADGVMQTCQPAVYNNLNDFDYVFPYRTKQIGKMQGLDLLEPYFTTKICNSKAWNGGSSVEITGSLNSKYKTIIKLFKVNIPIENNHEIFIDLNVWGLSQKLTMEIILSLRNKKIVVIPLSKSMDITDWTSLKFAHKFKEKNDVRGIFLSINNNTNAKVDYNFKLGGLTCYDHLYKKKIEEIELKNTPKFVKLLQAKYNYRTILKRKPNIKILDLYCEMDIPKEVMREIKYFRIFDLNNKWILNTRHNFFQLENLKEVQGKEVGVKIQVVLNNGFHMKTENINPVVLEKSKIQSFASILE